MSEMIERVARAICMAERCSETHTEAIMAEGDFWLGGGGTVRTAAGMYRKQARAAIEAMREIPLDAFDRAIETSEYGAVVHEVPALEFQRIFSETLRGIVLER